MIFFHFFATPSRYRSVYDPVYAHLLNSTTDAKVQHFIDRGPPLRSYVKELEKLKSMSRSVESLPITVPMYLFLIDCKYINQVSASLQPLCWI